MNKVAERQAVVRLSDPRKVGGVLDVPVVLDDIVGRVDLHGRAHPHVLRPLHDGARLVPQEVALLERLEAKIVKAEITRVVNHRFNLGLPRDDPKLFREAEALHAVLKGRRSVLLMIVHGDAGGQQAVVGVAPTDHHSARLGRKAVQVRRVNTVLNLTAYFLGHESGVDVLKTFGEFFDAGENLVEGDLFSFSASLGYEHYIYTGTIPKWSTPPTRRESAVSAET